MSTENFVQLKITKKSVKHTLQRIYRGSNVDRPRSKAWKEIKAKLIEDGRLDPQNRDHIKALLRTFHDVSPTPQELFDLVAQRKAGEEKRQDVLQELKTCLDLVHNEAEFWMWRLWPEEAKPRIKRQPSLKDQFVHEVRDRQRQHMPRVQAWLEIQALGLLDQPKGLFISLWKFTTEECETWGQVFYTGENGGKPKTRRNLWNFLVNKLVINDHDRQEVAAFRRCFFSISETPEQLSVHIDELHQTHTGRRAQARWILINEFRNQTIPGEIDHHLDDRWPEEESSDDGAEALRKIVDFKPERRPIINETAVAGAMDTVIEMAGVAG